MADQANPNATMAQMLSMGAQPSDIIAQMQMQRKMQIANALLQQGLEPMGGTQMAGQVAVKNSPLQGVAKIAQILAGNKMANDLTQQYGMSQASIAQKVAAAQSAQNGDTGQISSGVQSAPAPNGGTPAAGTAMANPNADALTQSMMQNPQPSPQPQPQGQLPTLNPFAGQSPMAIAAYKLSDFPGAMKTIAEANKSQFEKIPDIMRLAAGGGQDPAAAARAAAYKANAIELGHTRDDILYNPITGEYKGSFPDNAGNQIVPDGQGGYQKTRVQGANAADVASAAANKYGSFIGEPAKTFDANGNAHFTNPQSIMPPPAQLGLPQTPGAAPGGSAPGNGGGGQFAEAPAGVVPYKSKQGEVAAGRVSDIVADNAAAPMRLNVLDNIIDLSRQGIASGPGQEWKNTVGGWITNNPAGAAAFPQWKEQVTGAQELHKFIEQNGIRAWQNAGGSGTDSQLNASKTSNPNDAMFPQSMQNTALWTKAGIMAEQAKGNAWQQWVAKNPDTPASQQAFENMWANQLHPNDYIKQVLPPKTQDGFQLHQNQKTGQLMYFGPNGQQKGIWQ